MNAGWLVRPVRTRWGTYSTGLAVHFAVLDDGRVFVCFDGAQHITQVCHGAVCLRSAVTS